MLSSIYKTLEADVVLTCQSNKTMATYLKYENGMLIPEGKNYPSTMQLLKSAKRHLKTQCMLNRKRRSGSAVLSTILIVLALAVNTVLTIAIAVN